MESIDDIAKKIYIRGMNRFKDFIEWQAFGVLTSIGEKNWYCNQPYQNLVHLYFTSYHGLAHCYLYDPRFLNEP